MDMKRVVSFGGAKLTEFYGIPNYESRNKDYPKAPVVRKRDYDSSGG
jgi:hypothetical protein